MAGNGQSNNGNGSALNSSNGNGGNVVGFDGGIKQSLSIKSSPTIAGHVAVAREQLMQQAQKLAQKRSDKPPKLPPRDTGMYHPHDIPKVRNCGVSASQS